MEGLFFSVRSVYGRRAIYPANRSAELIAALAGKKTVDARDLAICQELGFGMALEGVKADLAVVQSEKEAQLRLFAAQRRAAA